jgi:hypothetical protein
MDLLGAFGLVDKCQDAIDSSRVHGKHTKIPKRQLEKYLKTFQGESYKI